jgi:hypothetical protein
VLQAGTVVLLIACKAIFRFVWAVNMFRRAALVNRSPKLMSQADGR